MIRYTSPTATFIHLPNCAFRRCEPSACCFQEGVEASHRMVYCRCEPRNVGASVGNKGTTCRLARITSQQDSVVPVAWARLLLKHTIWSNSGIPCLLAKSLLASPFCCVERFLKVNRVQIVQVCDGFLWPTSVLRRRAETG